MAASEPLVAAPPPAGTTVEVYRNLTRKCWSLRDPKTRRLLCHATALVLEKVEFRVSEATRRRVVATRRKQVHAVIRGTLTAAAACCPVRVGYRPFFLPYFYRLDTNAPVTRAEVVQFTPDAVYALV